MTDTDPTRVEIQGKVYELVPQGIGRIQRKLTLLSQVFGEAEGAEQAIENAGSQLHEVICIFVPHFMPEWEFEGYASQTAKDQDQYDEEADRSPTLPEIIAIFEAIYRVNGAERLTRLVTKFVDPQMLRTVLRNELVRWASERSQSLPSPNGASEPTSSSTSDPATPPATEPSEPEPSSGQGDSPSLASSIS